MNNLPGNTIFKTIFFCSTIMTMSACSYPSASLKVETSTDGTKAVKLVYPSPKMSQIEVVSKGDNWAFFFAINDYKQISFPPPGAITDSKWLYYFALLDGNLQPLTEKPILFEKYDREGQTMSGHTQALVATNDGFAAVYLANDQFRYQRFNNAGERIGKPKNIIELESKPGFRDSSLFITYRSGKILFLLQERSDDFYHGGNDINLLEHDLHSGETKRRLKFIPFEKEWLSAQAMNVYFSDQSMLLAWKGQVETGRDPKYNSYTTADIYLFADCSLKDMRCKTSTIDLQTTSSCLTTIRFIRREGKLSLAIQTKDAFWHQKLGPDRALAGPPQKLDDKQKQDLIPKYYANKPFPHKISIGP